MIMNKQDEKFVNQVKRKLGCELVNCVSHVTFTVSEFEHLKYKSRVRAYSGQCEKCHCVIKLTGTGFVKFQNMFGATKLVITKSNFDNMFDVENDK